MVLLNKAAKTVNLSYPGYCAQLRCHHPVLKSSQFGRAQFIAVEGVLKHLAQSGADRSHFRSRTRRQRLFCFGQSFEDQLACEVDINIIFKYHNNL
ncbi:MAG: hypothetical protein ACD_39C01941G0002 [uncultured bacterium]|nr:MAG: hypothetical protein ACD_39C01941G0002 [uncultured bacterium]